MIGNIMIIGWYVLVLALVIGLMISKKCKSRTLETVLAFGYCIVPFWMIGALVLCLIGI